MSALHVVFLFDDAPLVESQSAPLFVELPSTSVPLVIERPSLCVSVLNTAYVLGIVIQQSAPTTMSERSTRLRSVTAAY
jgi:hypothetical protein